MKQTTDLELNSHITCELDVSAVPHATPNWADMGVMFKNLSQSLNEVLYQAAYLSGGGWSETEVTGGQLIVTFTGDRRNGDAVSDYIFSPDVQLKFGAARKTTMRIRRGTQAIVWAVTLANITDVGGDTTAPNAVTLVVHSNGAPVLETVSADA